MLNTLLLAVAVAGYAYPGQVVDTAWVAAHARDGNVRVLDLRRSGFAEGHVPDAQWLATVDDVTAAGSIVVNRPGHVPDKAALSANDDPSWITMSVNRATA